MKCVSVVYMFLYLQLPNRFRLGFVFMSWHSMSNLFHFGSYRSRIILILQEVPIDMQQFLLKTGSSDQKLLPSTNPLTVILLTWIIWWTPNNASRWQMGFNLAFKRWKYLQVTFKFNIHGSVHLNNILIQKFQQDAHVREFILSDDCSTCFGYHYHPSSGAQNNCNYSIW
jgi:hypothetical protein